MNFVVLHKYHTGKILPIYSTSAIFAHKSHFASFLHGLFRNPSCYFSSASIQEIFADVKFVWVYICYNIACA